MKDCERIESKYGVDENIVIPRFVWESVNASHERTLKRLILTLVLTLLLLAGTNMAWLHVFNSYELVTEDVSIDSQDGGNASYIGASGIINNGESGSKKTNQTQEKAD